MCDFVRRYADTAVMNQKAERGEMFIFAFRADSERDLYW